MAFPIYNVGDEVAFRNRCQPGMPPFNVSRVENTLFGPQYQVGYDTHKWWTEVNLMPYSEWKKK